MQKPTTLQKLKSLLKIEKKTAFGTDCFSKLLSFTQSIPVQAMLTGVYAAYIDEVKQDLPSSWDEVDALQNELYTTILEAGYFVAFDNWSVLEGTFLNKSFLKYTSKDHSDCKTRLKGVDVSYSVNLAIDYLERGKQYEDANELKDAFICYSLAISLTKLINDEAYLSLPQKGMMLLSTYNIFRILCYLQPAQEVKQKEEWQSFKVLKDGPKEEHQLNLPPMPTEKKNDEADALKRVLQNATITKPKVPLSQLIGQKEALDLIDTNLITPMSQSNLFKHTGSEARKKLRGLLLFGPPGNGKTLLAQAAASCAEGMTFITMDISQLQSKWKGMTDSTIRSLFKVASMNTPCLVFIDEIESILAKRSDQDVEGNSSTVATMLVESQKYEGVFFIGATNKPWLVDSGFYRRLVPVYVKMPTKEERFELLRREFLLIKTTLTTKSLKEVADWTAGFSFDDINNFIARLLDGNAAKSIHAKYFKKTSNNLEDEEQYCPCHENDPMAIPKTIKDLPPHSVTCSPVTMSDVIATLKKCKPTVDKDSLKLFKKFDQDALNGFQDFLDETGAGGQDKKFEFYRGFNKDLEKGTYDTTRRSTLYRSFRVHGKAKK